MVRTLLSILAGFILWTILWLAGGALLAAVAPDQFADDGTTTSAGILLLFLVLSVLFSVASGFVTARLATQKLEQAALYLGVLLLIVGLFVQISAWSAMPVWYHLLFLAFLVPAAAWGGRLYVARLTTA